MGLFDRARDVVGDVADAITPRRVSIRDVAKSFVPGAVFGAAQGAARVNRQPLRPAFPMAAYAQRKPMADVRYEDGSGVQNGVAYGAGDSAGDVPRPLAVRGGYRPGIGSYDVGTHEEEYPGAIQGSMAEGNFASPMQVQRTSTRPMQAGFRTPQRAAGYGALDYDGELRVR